MALRRRIATRAAVAAMLAGVAVGFAGAPAQAATGNVIILSPTGPDLVLRNPPAGCRTLGTAVPPDSVVHNQTDSQIALYSSRGCLGTGPILPPGGSVAFAPGSIRVFS